MARYRKESLYAGTWTLPDGRRVTYTRDDIPYFRQRAKDMLAAGLSLPVAWRHQDVVPMTDGERQRFGAEEAARQEKLTLGWVEDAFADNGPLDFVIETPDEADGRQLEKCRFVSPEIQTDFVDGTGRLWPGKSITHLAVTSRPVQSGQKPFVRLAHDATRPPPERLSLEGFMAEKDDDTKPGKPEKPEAPETPEAAPAPEAPAVDPNSPEVLLPRLIQALRAHNMNIPDSVTDLQHLVIAIEANQELPAEPDPNQPPEDPDVAGQPVAGAGPASAPVMMSLDAAVNPAAARVIELERADVGRRIDALKSVTRPVKDRLKKKLAAERLSLDDRAHLAKTDLLVELAAFESLDPLPIHAQASGTARLSQDAVPVPTPHDDAEKAREKAIQDDIDERAARISVGRSK